MIATLVRLDVYLVTAFIPSTGDGELATGEPAETPLLAEEAAAL